MTLFAPNAKKKPLKITRHNDARIDDYFWLRDKSNPEVLKYLESENSFFENQMKPLKKLKKQLFEESKARLKPNDSSPFASRGDYCYYSKFKKGFQYPIFCRKKKLASFKTKLKSQLSKEEILIDCNQLAKGKDFFDSTENQISENHKFIAYSVDYDGSEKFQIQIKEISTGKHFETLSNCSGSFLWANDHRTLFYVVQDLNLRPFRVYKHRLGKNPKTDQLVYEENDPKQFIHLTKSNSGEFIFIESQGKVTSEIWFIEANTPDSEIRCFEARKEGIEYQLEHWHQQFLILTNYRAKNFRVMQVQINKLGRKFWKTLLPENKNILLTSILPFNKYLAISERSLGLPQIRILNFETQKKFHIKFNDPAYDVRISSDNLEFDTDLIRLSYSSPIQPLSIFDYNMQVKKSKTIKETKIKGHNPKNYTCKRVFVQGYDGVKIPLTIVHKKTIKTNGKAPGYMYGYGSYGAIVPDAFFSRNDVYRLIDRGFVFALAHIRGGSNMGRHWYENGKSLKKKNTFKDFISCAEYLGKSKLIDKGRLAIAGGSAGGMLVGACMNMRPDLFKAVVAHVPFVDVLNTMFDKDLPLTQTEYKEWGNPEDQKYYHYIKSYSPYDNVSALHYPHVFVTGGLNDPRVTYWEPAKWVAKLRELKCDNNLILFKTNMQAGHAGVSGRFDYLHEQAEEYAFLLNIM
jgi:oligopeptidase B